MPEELAEIRDLEVFDAAEFPRFDVAQIARNFEAIPEATGEALAPPLVIGHSEDQAILRDSGLPAAGWVCGLRAAGTKLLADVRDVPRLVAEAIGRRAYKRISAELYTNYKGMGQALRRVALLGGAIPKVKTLQDVIALYGEDEPFETVSTVPNAECEAAAEPVGATGGSPPKGHRPEACATREGGAEAESVARQREIARFCEELKREGHYAPAWDELGLGEFLVRLDAEQAVCFAEGSPEQTALAWFEGFLRRLPAVVSFSEKAPATDEGIGPGRKGLVDFYRRHRAEFESMGVTMEMFLAAEER